jgi:predicted MFS family arabinose efflux permease
VRPLYLLMLLSVLNHSTFAGTRVAVSLYAIRLGETPFTVGTLMALYSLLPMLFAVSIGRLTDRFGVRAPMLTGSAVLAASALVPFLWPGIGGLYAASILIGSSFMLYHVAGQNIVGYIGRPEDRAANFSVAALGFSISGFSGPMLAGFGIDGIGYSATFLVFSLLPLVPVAVLALDKLRLPKLPGHGVAPSPKRRLADLFQHRELRRLFVVSGLLAMAWDLFNFAVPIYGTRIGLSASRIGVVLGSFSVATFVVRLFLPAISRRLTAWPLLVVSLVVAGASFVLFPVFRHATALMLIAFLLGLGLGMSQPMVMSLMHNATPPGRVGEAVGVRMTLVNMSQTGMPLLFGALGSALGMAPVFWATALLLLAGGFVAKRHHDRRTRSAAAKP